MSRHAPDFSRSPTDGPAALPLVSQPATCGPCPHDFGRFQPRGGPRPDPRRERLCVMHPTRPWRRHKGCCSAALPTPFGGLLGVLLGGKHAPPFSPGVREVTRNPSFPPSTPYPGPG